MPKMRMSMPGQTQVHVKKYSSFKGVDFSSDPTQVEESRSPDAANVIADATGCPRKRPGWRKLCQLEAPVRGIYQLKTIGKEEDDKTIPAVDEFIIHAGSKLYRWAGVDAEPAEIMSDLTGESSTGFMHDDRLYILTGKEFLYVKVTSSSLKAGYAYKDVAYVPLTRIGCAVMYVTRDGFSQPSLSGTSEGCDEINLATNHRKMRFVFDQSSIKGSMSTGATNCMMLRLDENLSTDVALSDIKIVTEQGNTFIGSTAIDSGNVYIGNGYVVKLPSAYPNCIYMDGPLFLYWLEKKKDTSTSFTIEFPVAPPEKKPDLYERINKCCVFEWYNSRLFVTGNPDYPNADWFSNVGEPTYIPEINYTEIGNDDSKIMGYLPVGNQQAVIKSDSLQLQDASVYLRRSEWDDEQGYYFPLQRGITGAGAVSEKAITTFVDDAIYLSSNGVMGIIAENITGERVLAQRSTRINAKLLNEDLKSAAMCVWNGYLLIAVGGHVYLADSRQKSYARNVAGNFEYEWYYWDNVPAMCLRTIGTDLYFGTGDGKLCKLNTDLYEPDGEVSLNTYSDWPDGLSGEPEAIVAQWATKFDDDGDFTVKKNLCRRGCGIFLKGTKRGNVKICVRTDKDYNTENILAHRKRSMFSFEDMDFENFSFRTSARMVAAPNRKVKKYAALQIICRSDEINNDFALMGIEKRFVTGFFEK